MPGGAVERSLCARWLALCFLSLPDALSAVKDTGRNYTVVDYLS